MTELASYSTILVVPVEPVSASDTKLVINRIKARSGVSERSQDATEEEGNARSQSNIVPWRITNKYYTADVQYHILDPTSANLVEEAIENGEEPAVIVLTRSQESPPSALTTLLEQLAARTPEFDVALLVTLPLSNSTSNRPPSSTLVSDTPNEDEWDDIAIDNGFEWIELPNLSSKAPDERAATEDEHGEGLGRIRDALESHMWEGMERVTKSSGSSKNEGGKRSDLPNDDLGEFDDVVGGEEEEIDGDNFGVPPLPEPRPFIPTKLEFPSTFLPSIPRKSAQSNLSTTSTSSTTAFPLPTAQSNDTSFDDDFSPFVQATSSSNSFSSFPPSSSLFPSATMHSDGGSNQEGEDLRATESEGDLDELDSLFDKIRLAREEVLVEGEGIDEEEMLRRRRERAEKLLAEVMGGM